MKIRNAEIGNTFLGFGHGGFTYEIAVDYGGSVQTFGNYGLDGEENVKKLNLDNKDGFGIRAIKELMRAVGAESWEDLMGMHVRVEGDEKHIERI